MKNITYRLIRSDRKTVALELRPDTGLTVRAPRWATDREIEAFVLSHRAWIDTHIARMAAQTAQREALPKLTRDELDALAREALDYIPRRVAHFAPLVGVTYGRITIRNQKTRWGSCSGKGNLNFNCLLMLAPQEVLDSVIIHELCHRLVANHSEAFYREVLRVMPDYRIYDKWLREHGRELLSRMTGI